MPCLDWLPHGGFAVLLASTFVTAGTATVHAESTTSTASGVVFFPQVSGSNLEGEKFALPGDFGGEVNLAIVAFQRWHQELVDTWVPDAKKLKDAHRGFRYYELPTIYRGNPLFRMWLDKGMASGIPDLEARRVTITLYLDKPEFRAALGIADEKTIHLFLVDKAGKILWRGEGGRSDEQAASLCKAVEELTDGTP